MLSNGLSKFCFPRCIHRIELQECSDLGDKVFHILRLLCVSSLRLLLESVRISRCGAFCIGFYFYFGDGLGRSPNTFRESLATNLFLYAPVFARCFNSAGIKRIARWEEFPSSGNLMEFTLGVDHRAFVGARSKDVCCNASGWFLGC